MKERINYYLFKQICLFLLINQIINQGLDGKINSILSRHHKDYVSTFNEFMDTVKKDLREKMNELEKTDKDKNKGDDILLLKAEKDFFRHEAIRLNELCKELSQANDELMREINFKTSDIKMLAKKWKESEHTNKQLLNELERNISLIKNYEKEKKGKSNNNDATEPSRNIYAPNINTMYASFGNSKNNKNNSNPFYFNNVENSEYQISNNNNSQNNNESSIGQFKNLNSSIYNNMNINLNNSNSSNFNNRSTEDMDYNSSNFIFDGFNDKEKFINILNKLRSDLKREKSRNQKIIAEFNKILIDKNNIEKIFMECVEETRKEIFQRRMRETAFNSKATFFASTAKKGFNSYNIPIVNEIKYEHFQATDKIRLIQKFLMNDELINFVKENLTHFNNDNKNNQFFKNNSLHEGFFKQSHYKNYYAFMPNNTLKTKPNLKANVLKLPYSLVKEKNSFYK